jgi:hypothetical protein
MGEVVDWRSFFIAGDLSGKRSAAPHSIISIDAVSAKNVPFESLIDTSHPLGELSPKNPSIDQHLYVSSELQTCLNGCRCNANKRAIVFILFL